MFFHTDEKYLQEMSKVDVKWGGTNEIVPLAHALKRSIKVFTFFKKEPECYGTNTDLERTPILLGYDGDHYYSLQYGGKKKKHHFFSFIFP